MRVLLPFILCTFSSLSVCSQIVDWAQAVGSANSDETITQLELNQQQQLISAGRFSDSSDLDPGPGTAIFTAVGGDDVFFAAFDTAGNYLWAKQLASSRWIQVNQLRLDKDDNIWISGRFSGTTDFDPGPGNTSLSASPLNQAELFLAKYDNQGNFLWVTVIEFSGVFINGTTGFVETDGLGNAFLAGNYDGTICFDSLGTQVCFDNFPTTFRGTYLAKFNAAGDYQWGFTLLPDGPASASFHRMLNFASDKAGNAFLASTTSDNLNLNPLGTDSAYLQTADHTAYIAKYLANGELAWYRQSGDFGQNEAAIHALKAGGNGDLYLTGYFAADTLVWESDSPDGTFFGAGSNIWNGILMRIGPQGEWKWGFSFGAPTVGWEMDLDGTEQILLSGDYGSSLSIDLDPGPDTVSLPPPSPFGDIFLANYDSTGQFLWSGRLDGKSESDSENLFEIVHGPDQEFYLAGFVIDTLYMDLAGAQNTFISDAGNGDGFIARYNACADFLLGITDSLHICDGDSIFIGNQWISESGEYDIVASPGLFACDTLSRLVVTVFDRDSVILMRESDSLYVSGNWISYQWYLDSTLLPVDTNSFVILATEGEYQVAVTDSNGCEFRSSPFPFPATSVAEEDIQSSQPCGSFVVFPNPSKGELFAQLPAGKGKWTIYDQLGRTIQSHSLPPFESELLDISWLKAGTYVMTLEMETGRCRQRFVRY